MAKNTTHTKDNDDPWKNKEEWELHVDDYQKYLDCAGKFILFHINHFFYIDLICIFAQESKLIIQFYTKNARKKG